MRRDQSEPRPHRPGDPPDGGRARLPGAALVARLLATPLFWKILPANVALAAIGAAGGWAWADRAPWRAALAAAAAVGGVAVNAALVRLALRPVSVLERTASQVRAGDLRARAGRSSLADPEMARLAEVFDDMLDALVRNQARQKDLARRVLEAEERERAGIAHELFAGTAQTLAGVLVRLRLAERNMECAGHLHEVRAEVVHALDEVRAVARRLRPPELDELGVRAALEAHARALTEPGPAEVRFRGRLPALRREVGLGLFRVVQEAITNAVLHAEAGTVSVRFQASEESVAAEVEDDGKGFELADVLAEPRESLGIFGMHERAGYLQGAISIETGPGRGTVVRVRIPLVSEVEESVPAGSATAGGGIVVEPPGADVAGESATAAGAHAIP